LKQINKILLLLAAVMDYTSVPLTSTSSNLW